MKLGQQLTLLFDSAGSNALAVIIIKSSGTPRYLTDYLYTHIIIKIGRIFTR